MKLTDLDPRWLGYGGSGSPLGLTFLCPHCLKQRLGIAFHHEGHALIEDAVIRAKSPNEKIWEMSGTSFADMTISPSIDASASGHWHGSIRSGNCE